VASRRDDGRTPGSLIPEADAAAQERAARMVSYIDAQLETSSAALLDWVLLFENRLKSVGGFFVDVSSLPDRERLQAKARAQFLDYYAGLSAGEKDTAYSQLERQNLVSTFGLTVPTLRAKRSSIEDEEQRALRELPSPLQTLHAEWPRVSELVTAHAELASALEASANDDEGPDDSGEWELPLAIQEAHPALDGYRPRAARDSWKSVTPFFLDLGDSIGLLLEPQLASAQRFPLVRRIKNLRSPSTPDRFELIAADAQWLLDALSAASRGDAQVTPPSTAAVEIESTLKSLNGDSPSPVHRMLRDACDPSVADEALAVLEEELRALPWAWGERWVTARRITERARRQLLDAWNSP